MPRPEHLKHAARPQNQGGDDKAPGLCAASGTADQPNKLPREGSQKVQAAAGDLRRVPGSPVVTPVLRHVEDKMRCRGGADQKHEEGKGQVHPDLVPELSLHELGALCALDVQKAVPEPADGIGTEEASHIVEIGRRHGKLNHRQAVEGPDAVRRHLHEGRAGQTAEDPHLIGVSDAGVHAACHHQNQRRETALHRQIHHDLIQTAHDTPIHGVFNTRIRHLQHT
jgi:hypothetical protein